MGQQGSSAPGATDPRAAAGDAALIVGGVGLLVASFFPWFDVELAPGVVEARNGWADPSEVFSILAVLIGVALAAWVGLARAQVVAAPPGIVVLAAALVAAAALAVKWLRNTKPEFDPQVGLWLGLVCGALLVVGALLRTVTSPAATSRP